MKSKIKATSSLEEQLKRRPSIEMAPSMERPVYIITRNLNGTHIIKLTEMLDQQRIAYQMQQDTSSLGSKFNQRFFVIVDNRQGEVVLGPQFGSILMTVVGYPRVGKNKKNKYFENPKEIIAFYRQFKIDQDISDRQKSLIQTQYSDIILQNDVPASHVSNSKIQVRSISKYKAAVDSDQKGSQNSSKQNINRQTQRIKLFIIENPQDEFYIQFCQQVSTMDIRGVVERIHMEQVVKRSMFHTKEVKIFYLCSLRHKRELAQTITIGEIIVFSSKQDIIAMRSIIREQKIYAICCQKRQAVKILEKLGIVNVKNSQMLPLNTQIKNEKVEISAISQQSQQIQPVISHLSVSQHKKSSLPYELSKIDQLQSVFENNVQESIVQESVTQNSAISQSSNTSKIKRLKHAKPKINLNPPPSSDYFPIQKENQVSSVLSRSARKKTLKSQEKPFDSCFRSKKSLKFIDELNVKSPRIRRIKSIEKCLPQTVIIKSQNISTMTQQYFPTMPSFQHKSKLTAQPRNSSRLTFNSPSSSAYFEKSVLPFKQSLIQAVFYRQFIPQFHNIVQFVRLNPSPLFEGNTQIYQSFFNVRQFDRAARKIKQKMRQKLKTIQVFNFIVMLPQDEQGIFQKYCEQKNRSYDEDNDMEATFQSTLSNGNFKLNLYLFIQSEASKPLQIVDFDRIRLFKNYISSQDINTKIVDYLQRTIRQTKDNYPK